MVYNMGGVDEFDGGATRPIRCDGASSGQSNAVPLDQPHAPSTRTSTARRPASSPTRSREPDAFNAQLGTARAGLNDPSELVTGEHSGLANTRPGNPGTIDPPTFDDVEPGGRRHAPRRHATSTAITAKPPTGETPASVSPVTVAADAAP